MAKFLTMVAVADRNRSTGEHGVEAVDCMSGCAPEIMSGCIPRAHRSEARGATKGRKAGAFESSGGSNRWVERVCGLCGPDIPAGVTEIVRGGCRFDCMG